MWFMLNTHYSFWESGIWVCVMLEVPIWWAPNPNPGQWVSNELLWLTTFHLCCHNPLLEELSSFCVNPLEEDPWKLAPGFLQTSPEPPFSFADFALYPFAIINQSHEYDYMLNPGALLVNHGNWREGGVLGISKTDCIKNLRFYSKSSGSHSF